jgi:hypothetical protein
MSRVAFLMLLIVFLLPSFPATVPLGIKRDGHLDMAVLRKAYMESEFESVRASLEGFLKEHPRDVAREEKIFTHMYLGVICAADSNSEAKAESHFNSLLKLSPHIEPVDMFVPPKIQSMFDRIKQDFLKREEYVQKYDAFGNPIGVPGRDSAAATAVIGHAVGYDSAKASGSGKRVPSVSNKGKHAWIWWTLGSAAMVAGGVGAYALIAPDEEPAPRVLSADGTLK